MEDPHTSAVREPGFTDWHEVGWVVCPLRRIAGGFARIARSIEVGGVLLGTLVFIEGVVLINDQGLHSRSNALGGCCPGVHENDSNITEGCIRTLRQSLGAQTRSLPLPCVSYV